jgi:hypothetical protein
MDVLDNGMGRPTKQGIDYFPLDVDFNDNVEMYLTEKESNGLSVLITTWQLIYKNNGYFIEDNHDLYVMIKKRVSLDLEIISDCIKACLSRNIFDKSLHEKYEILTSSGIQERYFDAAKKKKEVKFDSRFLLIKVDSYENTINVGINGVDSCENATKEKEKEKEKKKKHIYGEFKNVLLTDEENQKLKDKYKDKYEWHIENLSEAIARKGYKYKSHYLTILKWDEKKETTQKSKLTIEEVYAEIGIVTPEIRKTKLLNNYEFIGDGYIRKQS